MKIKHEYISEIPKNINISGVTIITRYVCSNMFSFNDITDLLLSRLTCSVSTNNDSYM